ncbi:Kae1-associated serine/threonine protein kinase [archaeon]|nr:Kae1-associated serine/threonine protein kinase [archaeon]MBT6762343.1 Kae1-associated serine/threonine protein kinase [archaeon]
MELIAQGAEAKLFRDKNRIIKERISKGYRLPQLDNSLRRFRTRREAKILGRLNEMKFPAPQVHDFCDKRMSITMDFVAGETLREVLRNPDRQDDYIRLAEEMGRGIGRLHMNNMVHGDLTTANMIENAGSKKLTFIDFGLSAFSDKKEDKAVDLHLLDRNLESSHSIFYPQIFEHVISAYKKEFPESEDVFKRLETVAGRGRNKK